MDREYIRPAAGVEGEPGSAWLATEAPEFASGCPSGRFDIAIVGGGLVGMLTARHLSRTGARVALLERRRLAAGVSGHSTAKVTVQHAADWHRLVGAHDPEALSRWAHANAGVPAELEALIADLGEQGRGCGFARIPSALYALDDEEARTLEREIDAYRRLGLEGVTGTTTLPWRTVGPTLRMPDQAIVDPAALIMACALALPSNVSIWEQAAVRDVVESDTGVTLHCDGGSVEADRVVMAGNIPTLDTAAYFSRLYQYRSYAFVVRTAMPIEAASWIPASGQSGVNLRPLGPESDGRWIASGVDHKAGHGGDERGCYALLAANARELLPDATIERHWSTQDPHTPDGLPFVGRAPFTKRLYMASGFGGWGMTKSFVTARLLADLLAGSQPDLADLLDPGRTDPLKGFGRFVGENIDTGTQVLKSFVHPTVNAAAHGADAAPELEVVGEGGSVDAVWHEPDAADHIRSAHCTHMGCVLHANQAEVTWDCPCHGSRFAADATVIHGPAKRDLRPAGTHD